MVTVSQITIRVQPTRFSSTNKIFDTQILWHPNLVCTNTEIHFSTIPHRREGEGRKSHRCCVISILVFFCCLYNVSPPPPCGNEPVLRCSYGDTCRFRTLNVQEIHNCTRGCGGYLHGKFCAVQENKKSYFNKSALMTHMC